MCLVARVNCFRTYQIVDDVRVTLTAQNQLCDEIGLQQVNDLADCKKAVSKIQGQYPEAKFDGKVSNQFDPAGCSLYDKQNVHFNKKSGRKNRRSQHICYEGN